MSRILLFSDLHLKPETEAICMPILDNIIQEAVDRKIPTIGFLGDFWHMRYQVPVHLLNAVQEWLTRIGGAGLAVRFLPGNHDQINVVGENALQVFNAPPNVKVYTEPTVDEFGAWLPYRKDHDVVKAALKGFRKHKARTLFAHLPVRGAMQNNLVADEDGLMVSSFKGFRRVILGHYHKRQEWMNGSMCYLGSPWQTRSDEWGQPKGFAVFDAEQNTLEFVDKKWGPRHHRFPEMASVEALAAHMTRHLVNEGDHVRVELPTKEDCKRVVEWLSKQGIKCVATPKEAALPQPRFAFKEGTSLTEYAHQYVQDKAEKEFDSATLMHVWGRILEGA